MAKKLGISKEQQGGSIVSLPAPIKLKDHNPQFPTGYIFPICKLESVFCEPKKKMKEASIEVEKPVLVFIFKDEKGRQTQHFEFPLDEDDVKFDSKIEWMHQRVRHIWDEVIGSSKFPAEGLGQEAENFEELFTVIAKAFNSQVSVIDEKETKVFSTVPLYIKLVYNKDRANIPLFPNFVQRAKLNGNIVACDMLSINPARESVEPVVKAAYTPGGNAGFGTPAAGNDVGGYEFPDV